MCKSTYIYVCMYIYTGSWLPRGGVPAARRAGGALLPEQKPSLIRNSPPP